MKGAEEHLQYGLPEGAVERIRAAFRRYPRVREVVLYGSRAKGNYRPGSDIDLCIRADAMGLTELLAIENSIDDLLLPWKVDLVLLHTIDNEALLDQIRRIGILFYSADEKHGDPTPPGGAVRAADDRRTPNR